MKLEMHGDKYPFLFSESMLYSHLIKSTTLISLTDKLYIYER
jgi:hypothetical protein